VIATRVVLVILASWETRMQKGRCWSVEVLLTATAVAGLVAAAPAWPQTEQLSVLPESGAAMGMVGGRLANVSDPSALRYSPTMILDIAKPELQANFGAWYANVSYLSRASESVRLDDPLKLLGSVYFVKPVQKGELAFGIGLSTPFGLSFNYPRDSAFRYVLPYEGTLLTVAVTPTIAARINDRIAVAAGLDIVYSSLELKQDFPWRAVTLSPGTPDGELKFDGNGWGLGGFASIRLDPSPGHRLTLTAHAPMTIDYDGDFKAGNLPPALGALGLSADSSFSSKIKYPGKVSVGYGVDLTNNVTAGIDFEWANNSVHEFIPLNIGNNQALLGTDRIVLNWRDSTSIGAGMEWRKTPHLAFRTGYMYTRTSMPDFTFTPAVASNDRHIFSGGVGYKSNGHSIDFAYSYVRMNDRQVLENQQPRFVGDYRFWWHIFTLSYRHAF
jgi:long-chain fatty acid transport protein